MFFYSECYSSFLRPFSSPSPLSSLILSFPFISTHPLSHIASLPLPFSYPFSPSSSSPSPSLLHIPSLLFSFQLVFSHLISCLLFFSHLFSSILFLSFKDESLFRRQAEIDLNSEKRRMQRTLEGALAQVSTAE